MRYSNSFGAGCVVAGLLLALAGAPKASGADMTPLAVTGFNLDVVVENTASGPPYNGFAVELRPGEGQAYYQTGLPGKSFGLPIGGEIDSELDTTIFQL